MNQKKLNTKNILFVDDHRHAHRLEPFAFDDRVTIPVSLGGISSHYSFYHFESKDQIEEHCKNENGKMKKTDSEIYELWEIIKSFHSLVSVLELYMRGCAGITTNGSVEELRDENKAVLILKEVFKIGNEYNTRIGEPELELTAKMQIKVAYETRPTTYTYSKEGEHRRDTPPTEIFISPYATPSQVESARKHPKNEKTEIVKGKWNLRYLSKAVLQDIEFQKTVTYFSRE